MSGHRYFVVRRLIQMQYDVSHDSVIILRLMISVVGFSTAVRAVGGRNGRKGFPKGRPLAYWGFFSDTKCCGSEKALIGYGFSAEEKPRARSGRMVGDITTCGRTTACVLSREDDCADSRSSRCTADSEWIGRRGSGMPFSTRPSLCGPHRRCQDKHKPVRATR